MESSKVKFKKKEVDIAIISDVHLGTYGCRAEELLDYLKSIQPKKLILNGDIVDMWQFSKHYWPSSHMLVIKHILGLIAKGVKVYYITGNHDELLRRFVGFKMGSLQILNKLVLRVDGKKVWIFHGDVFDVTMQHAKWLTKLGAKGYDLLILINSLANFFLTRFGRERISFSKKIKHKVKSAVKYINSFEETAAEIGILNGYQYVVCGHIHHPEIKVLEKEDQSIVYMNSGDWVENLSALEYYNNQWHLYSYSPSGRPKKTKKKSKSKENLNNKELFKNLHEELVLKVLQQKQESTIHQEVVEN